MGHRVLLAVVIFLSVCVTMAATNPTTVQYGAFLQASLSQALKRMEHTEPSNQRTIIQGVITAQGKRVIESLIWSNTVRQNYGLFSLFETQAFGIRVQVVGVGMHFFPLDGQEEIEKKLGQLVL